MLTGSDTEVPALMKSSAENGSYTRASGDTAAIQETFACGWSSEKEVAGEIRARYEQDGYPVTPIRRWYSMWQRRKSTKAMIVVHCIASVFM